uniref:Uncharacterized protein n=1 Tax=Meloidogyne floridensis TaxID=298350 RepID=A0A915NUR0_9BILA
MSSSSPSIIQSTPNTNNLDTPINTSINNSTPRIYSLNNPIYQKMREFIFDLCDKGIGAIASTEQLKDKFGEQVPTLCTIYKWRREYRGGKIF